VIVGADQLFAVVWHTSGRVDFEPLSMVLERNAMDLSAGRDVMRTLVAITETEVQAGDEARRFRAIIKEQRKGDEHDG
jgi:hypothetical protein